MSEETRDTMTRFWEVVTFLATAFAFLLIGLKADFNLLIAFAPLIVVAFAAIIIARILSVYPILWLAQLMGEKIPASWKKILAFAGLRGAVSIALVLSLPESNYRGTIQAMVFGVALLSLVVQAEVLQTYVKKESKEEDLAEETISTVNSDSPTDSLEYNGSPDRI
jgi:CPA1 family monovalent cation:H+ antiporter